MSLKLYELSESLNQVAYMMEEEGVEGLEGVLETIDLSFQQKAEGIIKLHHSKLTEAETIENEIKRLKVRSDKLKKDAAWLHEYVEREMLRSNTPEIKSSLFKIKIGANPPRVEITNQALLPTQYMRTSVSVAPNKMLIKDELQKGTLIPGAELRQDMKLKVK
ncbi:hypothetical protein BK133_00975 [Paenibacillus sp. FSL H8-0548]|uniref:siphovirus Gp157 family protein n=1 Tax=Paenibacillus sp. FSL H8-0548 TaxID=1920422 RepID=UPI00096D3C7E|nr:siphovirus Gp157 family protein [Paenibacillus sp. FSL H8-0548]OMF38807.1 hypothetical protein BK133_00975 [Paenibacillus sp. FSL H8-0548]